MRKLSECWDRFKRYDNGIWGGSLLNTAWTLLMVVVIILFCAACIAFVVYVPAPEWIKGQ